MKWSPAVLAVAGLLTSCVHQRHHQSAEFFCRAPSPPVPPPSAPGTQIPGGKLELKAIGSLTGELRARHLSIHAEGVTISLLGPRLGAALGAPVAVSQHALDDVVSLHFDDVTVEALGRALSRAAHLNVDTVHDAIWIESPRDVSERMDALYDPPPVSIQLYPLKHPQLARQLAELICRSMLTRHGYVSLVGQTLVVGDFAENQSRVRAAVDALDIGAAPSTLHVPTDAGED